MHPFLPRMKMWLCLTIILVVWFISAVVTLPLAIYQNFGLSGDGAISCDEDWPQNESKSIFTISSFVLQFIVPCSITSYCYTKVSLVLRNRLRSKTIKRTFNPGQGDKPLLKKNNSITPRASLMSPISQVRERDLAEIQRKRRTNRMLISMILVFCVCWMPLNFIHITQDLLKLESTKFGYYSDTFFFLAHLIAMSSIIHNSILYALMNSNFRRELKRAIFSSSRIFPFLSPILTQLDPDQVATTGESQIRDSGERDKNRVREKFKKDFTSCNSVIRCVQFPSKDPHSSPNLETIAEYKKNNGNNLEKVLINHSTHPENKEFSTRLHPISTIIHNEEALVDYPRLPKKTRSINGSEGFIDEETTEDPEMQGGNTRTSDII